MSNIKKGIIKQITFSPLVQPDLSFVTLNVGVPKIFDAQVIHKYGTLDELSNLFGITFEEEGAFINATMPDLIDHECFIDVTGPYEFVSLI